MEIELKYHIDDPKKINEIFLDPEICRIKDENTDETVEMHAVYFDTEDRRLHREAIAFRVRKEGSRLIATLKWNGSSDEGMHKREEINVPVTDERKLYQPDIHIFDQSQMCEELERIVGARTLHPVIEVYFNRRQARLDSGSCICEISADLGEIRCGEKTAPISELELEFYSGDEEEMTVLGQSIAERFQLTWENRSKFKRGLDLL